MWCVCGHVSFTCDSTPVKKVSQVSKWAASDFKKEAHALKVMVCTYLVSMWTCAILYVIAKALLCMCTENKAQGGVSIDSYSMRC